MPNDSAFDELIRRARRKGGRKVSHRLAHSAGFYYVWWGGALRDPRRVINLIGVGLLVVDIIDRDFAHVRFYDYGRPPPSYPLSVVSLFTGPDGRPCPRVLY